MVQIYFFGVKYVFFISTKKGSPSPPQELEHKVASNLGF